MTMNQSEQFLRFVQRRNEEALERWVVSVRIDEDALIVTQRWPDGVPDGYEGLNKTTESR